MINITRDVQRYNLLKHLEGIRGDCYCVITGKNGEGKSRLLRTMLSDAVNDGRWQTVIAVATTPFDIFPTSIPDTHNKIFYRYVGLKGMNDGSSAKRLIETSTLSLFSEKPSQGLIKLEKVLEFLGFKPQFEIIIKLSKNIHFNSKKRLVYKNFSKDTGVYVDIHDDLIFDNETIQEIKSIKDSQFDDVKSAYEYFSHFSDRNGLVKIKYELPGQKFLAGDSNVPSAALNVIYNLKNNHIFSIADIRLKKNDVQERISMRRTSSGEQCVLMSMLGIASAITDDSLILIDEPEISLHPYWQEKYIELLRTIFREFDDCTFVLATHSPLIVSKLGNRNNYIYDITKETLSSAGFFKNKSVDFQLANVFGSPGENNEYLTRILVSFLVKKTTLKKIDHKLMKEVNNCISLKKSMDENDPVFKLISLAELALEGNYDSAE